jgi:hypothetical protein
VVIIATVVELVSFWAIVVGVARGVTNEEAGSAAGPFALGFSLIPFAFLILAFGTNHRRAPGATLRAMGAWLIFGLPLIMLIDPATGMALGFGIGGIAAIRADEGHGFRMRFWWVVALAVYVALLVVIGIAPGPGALSASLLPFATVAFADYASEQKNAAQN